MATTLERMEKHAVKITFEFTVEEFKEANDKAYRATAKRYSVPGFRKGKVVPRKMIETAYGEHVFYEDALDILFKENYSAAIAEYEIRPYSEPLFDIVQLEDEKPVIFTVTLELMPEVTLGQYRDIELVAADYVVTEEAINEAVEKHIEEERKKVARMITVEDRAVADGDTVEIDYSGSVDGEKFEGGTAEHQELVIGSKSFIPGFEEQLIGMNTGDERNIDVTFPEDYHAEELKGKAAVFAVKLHAIRVNELPEMNDDLVQDISEYSTVAEYKEHMKEHVTEELEHEQEHHKQNDAIKKAVDNATILLPETMLKMEAESIAKSNFVRMGFPDTMELSEMCSMFGLELEAILEQFSEHALVSLQTEFLFAEIANAEKIELSNDELKEEATKYVESYVAGSEISEEQKAEFITTLVEGKNKEAFIQNLRMTKARDIIIETMVVK